MYLRTEILVASGEAVDLPVRDYVLNSLMVA